MRPETEAERQERHAATIAAYRSLVDPENPPREPYLIEQHFFTDDSGPLDHLTELLEERGFRVETLAYDPESATHSWRLVVVRLELLDERRILAVSDELDGLARQCGVTYDGWLTHVEG